MHGPDYRGGLPDGPGTILGIIGLVIGVPSLILAWPSIKNLAKSRFARHVIMLFGPKAAGKTTLLRYLQGKPLPHRHVQTHSYDRSGKIVYDLSGNSTFFFSIKEVLDVGGEFGSQLHALIARDNPHVVIFLCDTTSSGAEKKAFSQLVHALESILKDRLPLALRLRLLVVLLNKCDLWGNDGALQASKRQSYQDDVLAEGIRELRGLVPGLEVRIRAVSLTHPPFRIQTDDALREMALLLEEKPQ